MKALTWHGKRDVRVDTVPDPTDRAADRRDHPRDLDRPVRFGPAPLRGPRPVPRGRRRARPRADGHRRGGRLRGRQPRRRRSRRRAVQHLLRALLHVRARATEPVRDDAEPRARAWAPPLRLHEALRRGAGRPGRAACASPRPTTGRSRSPRARRTTASCSSPTSCPRRGRPCSTPRSPTAAAWPSSAWARSARCRRGSPSTWAPARSSAWTWCPSACARSQSHGVETIDVSAVDDVPAAVRELTDGRGPDSVIDAVGMEAHGAPVGKLAHTIAGLMPDTVARKVMENAGVDRLSALKLGDRDRPARRHGLALGRLRRDGRPAQHAADVRQAADGQDGPGERPPLGRRHHAAAA